VAVAGTVPWGGEGVKRGWFIRLTNVSPSVSRLSIKCAILDVSQSYGPPLPAKTIALRLLIVCKHNSQH
jgi:hypothetical protein